MDQPEKTISFLPEQGNNLPFKVLIMAPLVNDTQTIERFSPVEINKDTFDKSLSSLKPEVELYIENNYLCKVMEVEEQSLNMTYEIKHMSDFLPENIIKKDSSLSLVARLIQQLNLALQQEAFSFSCDLFDTDGLNLPELKQPTIERSVVELLACELELMLTKVLDQILHDENWQRLESCWKGVEWVCNSLTNSQDCIVECLPISRELLWDDLTYTNDIEESNFYQLLYLTNLGQYGGVPYGAVMLDDYFSAKGEDITLLKKLTEVCAISHSPLISGSCPEMFQVENFEELVNTKYVKEVHASNRYIKWRSFIASSDASYLSLTLPRIKIRDSYNKPPGLVSWYKEDVGTQSQNCLWTNASYAFLINLISSFEENSFCTRISGTEDGVVEHNAISSLNNKLPVEVTFSELKEAELISLGFNPICSRRHINTMFFNSSNSVRWGNVIFESKLQTVESMTSAQLQYLMITLRVIHCIKIMFREKIGSFDTSQSLESYLNRWLRQFVSDVEVPAESVRAVRPLKDGRVEISENERVIGWYDISISLVPHLKYLGNFVSVRASVPVMQEVV